LRETFSFLLSDLARRVSIRIDVIMLGLVLGPAAVGAYGAASRVVALLLFLPHFAGMALLPRIARLHAEDAPGLRLLFRQSLRLAVLAGIPAAAGLWLIADDLVLLIFGPGFVDAVPLLRLLAALVAIEALRSLLAVFLTGCDLQGWRTAAEWAALALAVLLQAVGIRMAGPAGSAVALLLSELALLAAFTLKLRTLLGWPPIAGRLLVASLASTLFVVLLKQAVGLALPFTIALAMLIYVACLLTAGPIRRDELQQVTRLLR
jgi:O-antigen/teichoic acid export membrane protein